MDTLDSVTWQALVAVLTIAGLVGTGVLWRRRGAASGLRMLALTLLPAAAYLTGTLRLFWEIGDAVVSWAVRFAFSPVVWAGIVLAGVAVVLWTVSAAMRRRGIGVRRTGGADREHPAAGAAEERRGLPERRSSAPAATEGDDEADIEAILRKHGIS